MKVCVIGTGYFGLVMHTAILIDGRNCLNPKTVETQGFQYLGMGR